MAIQTLYTGEATVTGAREGHARSNDGRLDVALSAPETLGGKNGKGTNPEQLFAAAWAGCFGGALEYMAKMKKISIGTVVVRAAVGVGPSTGGAFGLEAKMEVTVPGVDQATAEMLAAEADKACPYSNAVRGNVPVKMTVKAG
jgi:lipoyl-dependent peroxiredoxin